MSLQSPGHPGNTYTFNGNTIHVDEWNPPQLLVSHPLPGQNFAQSLNQHRFIEVAGNAFDTEGGIVTEVRVALNGEPLQTLAINSASAA